VDCQANSLANADSYTSLLRENALCLNRRVRLIVYISVVDLDKAQVLATIKQLASISSGISNPVISAALVCYSCCELAAEPQYAVVPSNQFSFSL
jgi:hypothetical protein